MLYLLSCLIMLLVMIITAALIATIFKIGLGPYITNRRQPLSAEQATVISKREETAETYSHNFERRFGEIIDPSDAVRMETADWFATFKLENGEEREFPVSKAVYESLIVGDQGKLTWRGDLFARFTLPGSKTSQPRPEKTVPDDWK